MISEWIKIYRNGKSTIRNVRDFLKTIFLSANIKIEQSASGTDE